MKHRCCGEAINMGAAAGREARVKVYNGLSFLHFRKRGARGVPVRRKCFVTCDVSSALVALSRVVSQTDVSLSGEHGGEAQIRNPACWTARAYLRIPSTSWTASGQVGRGSRLTGRNDPVPDPVTSRLA